MYICTRKENEPYMKPGKQILKNTKRKHIDNIQPVSISPTSKHIVAKQVITNPEQKISVKVHNLYTGRIITIGHKAATFLATKYPEEYKLIA